MVRCKYIVGYFQGAGGQAVVEMLDIPFDKRLCALIVLLAGLPECLWKD